MSAGSRVAAAAITAACAAGEMTRISACRSSFWIWRICQAAASPTDRGHGGGWPCLPSVIDNAASRSMSTGLSGISARLLFAKTAYSSLTTLFMFEASVICTHGLPVRHR